MIGYHCSFEHRDVCYALLEYADKHTLEHFMMHKGSVHPSTNEEILAFWENILCVIEAIGEIHDLDPDSEDAPEPGKFTGYDDSRQLGRIRKAYDVTVSIKTSNRRTS